MDYKRLGKQRIECLQILQTLSFGEFQRKLIVPQHGPYGIWEKAPEKEYLSFINDTGNYPFGHIYRKTPWYNHPAVRIWKGFKSILAHYGMIICNEWIRRGFKDSCREKISKFCNLETYKDNPNWLGNEKFHLSHKSNLIRKNPKFYRPIFGNDIPDNLPYYWPI